MDPKVTPLRLITWNIRYDWMTNPRKVHTQKVHVPVGIQPPLPVPWIPSLAVSFVCLCERAWLKENPWPERKRGLVAALQLHASTTGIICLQEVLHGQLQDLSVLLNEGHTRSSSNTTTDNNDPRQINNTSSDPAKKWEFVGVGRDDGATKGEYSPIFYNSEVHDLISWRCFWLSETPDRPGKGWDAASVRICTVVRFGFKGSGTHDFTIMVRTTAVNISSQVSVFSSFSNYCFSLLFVVFISFYCLS